MFAQWVQSPSRMRTSSIVAALTGALVGFASAVAVLPGCDPLYEEPFDGGWKVCCQTSRITTCPCARGESCLFPGTACPGGACVNSGGAEACVGVQPQDAGTNGDGGTGEDAGSADAGSPQPTGYEVCCVGGYVTSCPCYDGQCPSAGLQPCPGGRCAAAGSACP